MVRGIAVHTLYLSAILDLCDRRIMPYALRGHNGHPLAFKTFDRVVKVNLDAYPLFRSDRGCQYTTLAFHQKLVPVGIVQSMSRGTTVPTNGPMEDFWGIFKREYYYSNRFASKQELVQMVVSYIRYYNIRRIQRKLSMLTPMEKRQLCLAT